MKRKHQGMVSLGVLVAIMLVVGTYYYSGLWHRNYSGNGPSHPPLKDGWMPSKDQIETMQRLSGKLQTLATPDVGTAESAPLTVFGQRTTPSWRHGQDGDAFQGKTAHGLSMTLLAGPVRYCMVDGDFVAEGGRLKDGADVVKIEAKKVLIARGDKRTWVYLEEPPLAPDGENTSNTLTRKGSS